MTEAAKEEIGKLVDKYNKVVREKRIKKYTATSRVRPRRRGKYP